MDYIHNEIELGPYQPFAGDEIDHARNFRGMVIFALIFGSALALSLIH